MKDTNRSTVILTLALLFSSLAATTAFADDAPAPLDVGDFSWAPGNYAPPDSPFATKYFTPELRLDDVMIADFNHPADHTIGGSSEEFRSDENQITQIGVGGDFNYKNVAFRLMTQFGMYSTTTPRNDASPSRGQWDMADAYRYISEAYASYHVDAMKGVNIQAGIFMSYIGLWSYYNFDNWTYQPSYVSSNTPWFFNGVRIQTFPTDHLKIEYWLINGWQSYGMFNEQPGVGLQVEYRPNDKFEFIGNQYYGADTFDTPGRQRMHSDDSIMYKYYQNERKVLSKAAFSLTADLGCEQGGGVQCGNQYFLGFMAYNRLWFHHDHYGLTFGGGAITNPGRYLVLIPPINGATASNDSQTYFTSNPGDPFNAWDVQLTGDYMPTRNLTFRLEYTYRDASVPYFSGADGITPPAGSANYGTGENVAGWTPDLVKSESIALAAMLLRY